MFELNLIHQMIIDRVSKEVFFLGLFKAVHEQNLNSYFHIWGGTLWQYGLWSFQTGGTKLEKNLPRNQHTQRKLFNFENWISGGLRSFQKSEF